jgi:TetR/AcrR family transcriptional regulator, regulator of biofilm formation and stress response
MAVAAAGAETRERILRTTLELIGVEGIGAVTNRRVAAAAEISPGSLTYHFSSQSDLLRESLLLFVAEEVVRLKEIAAGIRRLRSDAKRAPLEVGRAMGESGIPRRQLAELELHVRAARDPVLRDASRRCFEAYEELAAVSLEILDVPEPRSHAPTVVALITGLGLRRLAGGGEDPAGSAEALLAIVRGASSPA